MTAPVLTELFGVAETEPHNLKHDHIVNDTSFSPDDKCIIYFFDDNRLKLWDVESGKEATSIKLRWIPQHINVSPQDTNLVITANGNGTITLFDLSKLDY